MTPPPSFEPLFAAIDARVLSDADLSGSFDDTMDRFLPEFLQSRAVLHEEELEINEFVYTIARFPNLQSLTVFIQGMRIRPLTRAEVTSLARDSQPLSPVILRKLKLRQVSIRYRVQSCPSPRLNEDTATASCRGQRTGTWYTHRFSYTTCGPRQPPGRQSAGSWCSASDTDDAF